MSDQKHFTYEGRVTVSQPKEIIVEEVVFLTPAKIKVLVDGRPEERVVSVDIINKKAYDEKGLSIFGDAIFKHLDEVNSLPDDFFAAPPEVYEKIADAENHMIDLNNSQLGDTDERTQ